MISVVSLDFLMDSNICHPSETARYFGLSFCLEGNAFHSTLLYPGAKDLCLVGSGRFSGRHPILRLKSLENLLLLSVFYDNS